MGRPLERDARRAARDARRVDRPDRDARHLPRHRPEPAAAGQQLLPALDDPRLPRRDERARRRSRPARRPLRAGEDVHARLRDLHRRVAASDDRLDARPRGRRLADRLPARARRRRGVPDCELGGDPDRRVPVQPARARARPEQRRRDQRPVHRTAARRPARADQLAARLPRLGAVRDLRNDLVAPQAARDRRARAGADRLAGKRDVRGRARPDHDRDHLRHPSLRRASDGVDEPGRARLPQRGCRAARCVRGRRVARALPDVQAAALPHPAVHVRRSVELPLRDRARRADVHADHLAAGHLAASSTATASAARRSRRASTCCR